MKYAFTLLLLLSLIACKKDPIQYKFSGKVTNKNTKGAIQNATISFSQKEISTNSLNTNFIPIGEVKSNSEGEYFYEFERKKILEVKLEFTHNNFYSEEIIIGSGDLSTEDDNFINASLDAIGWINIRLVNSFVEPNEQLNFYKHNVYEGCELCCTNGYTIVDETNSDTSFTCPVIGDKFFKYSYGEVIANSSFTDSIFCSPNDTTYLQVNY